MHVLVLNSGSSSIKFQLFDMGDGEQLPVKGMADKIRLEDSFLRSESPNGASERRPMDLPDHRSALQAVFEALSRLEEPCDAADIVFTAGIGENSPYLRGEILRPFGYLGLRVDEARNQQGQTVFSSDDSRVRAMRVPTNEELVIARDTCTLITGRVLASEGR